jgi:YVTN family beta-propeller protein
MRVTFNTLFGAAGLGLLAALVAGSAVCAPVADSGLQVQQRWKVGGAGGWDYLTLDAAGKRLFVSRATRVDVISTDSGKVIGTIPNTLGVHGIALAEDSKRGYTSNGKANSVTMFDSESLAVIREVKIAAQNPDAILYEPVGKHVFTFNGMSKDVSVLDAASLEVVATLAVPDKPEFAVDDGNGHIFVNIESNAGQMTVIDSGKLSVLRTFALPGCASPSGLAIDRIHRRLFSVCDGKTMAVTDADTGKQVARVPVGDGPDAAAFDSKRGLVFSSNGDGTLTIVREDTADHYTVQATLPTQRGARTMALDATTGKVYAVSSDFGPPPAPTAEQPHPRPVPVPDTFTVLVVGAR